MLSSFGPQGQALFDQLLAAIRLSLASAISQIFAAGAAAMVAALLITLLLHEIPLRRVNHTAPARPDTVPGLPAADRLMLAPEPVVADQ
jgi:hypothetical protein